MTRYEAIRDIGASRGFPSTGFLLAGIAYAETQLAHCHSELTWACEGPDSVDCGGGPVVAGAGDGPCSLRQGGLGMFQFDGGTFDQTLARDGHEILTLSGNISHAYDFATNMVRRSAYISASTNDAAIDWLNAFDYGNAEHVSQWNRTVTHYYNGCAPTYGCWSERLARYGANLDMVIAETGLDFWHSRPCVCSVGATEARSCGACGTSTRTCGSECTWQGWSACTGEGACSPGAVDTQACGTCGEQSRDCSATCEWADWTACDGQAPEPAATCDTGALGQCSVGVEVCSSGDLVCSPTNRSTDELCDGLDDDCDGEIDEFFPNDMGEVPPDFAVRIVSTNIPRGVPYDGLATAWVAIRNEGTAAWEADDIAIRISANDSNRIATMQPADSWPFADVPAVLEYRVEAGGEAIIEFQMAAPTLATDVTFAVESLSNGPISCPEPQTTQQIAAIAGIGGGGDSVDPPDAEVAPVTLPEPDPGLYVLSEDADGVVRGCSSGLSAAGYTGVLALLMLRRRRRA